MTSKVQKLSCVCLESSTLHIRSALKDINIPLPCDSVAVARLTAAEAATNADANNSRNSYSNRINTGRSCVAAAATTRNATMTTSARTGGDAVASAAAGATLGGVGGGGSSGGCIGGSNNNSNRSLSARSSDIEALEQKGYNIGKKIGKGSYATVMTAQYTDAASKTIKLACKIVNRSKAPDDFLDKFFPRELDILTKIEYPYIIQTHSILQRGPKIFIFMRFAENGDLLDYVKKNGPTPEHQAKIWFYQMVKGLKYLHAQNIAHRDLKCENILLSKRMNIKLADFGFARYCTDSNGQRILSQTYCGSGSYAAPEVVSGTPYNPKIADIWSLGIILFIMINSSMPFDDSNLNRLLSDQRKKKYQFGTKVLNKITFAVRNTIDSLLEPDITQRWSLEHILNCKWLQRPPIPMDSAQRGEPHGIDLEMSSGLCQMPRTPISAQYHNQTTGNATTIATTLADGLPVVNAATGGGEGELATLV